MNNKLKIIIDFDSTICPTHEAVLLLYREMTGDYGTKLDDKNLVWNMGDICRQWTKKQVAEVFSNPRLFDFIKPFPRAIQTLKKFNKDGHYLEVCSMHHIGDGMRVKRAYLENNIPFLDKITILPIETGLESFDKSSVKGDIIIDDKIDALESSTCPIKILYGEYTWNKNCDKYLRAKDWIDVRMYINHIEEIGIEKFLERTEEGES